MPKNIIIHVLVIIQVKYTCYFHISRQMIHIAGVIVLTQMLTHPEMYEESYFETYGRSPRSGMCPISC